MPGRLMESRSHRISSVPRTCGFGPHVRGEDPFDALMGARTIIAMCGAAVGDGDPGDPTARAVEGWILGRPAG